MKDLTLFTATTRGWNGLQPMKTISAAQSSVLLMQIAMLATVVLTACPHGPAYQVRSELKLITSPTAGCVINALREQIAWDRIKESDGVVWVEFEAELSIAVVLDIKTLSMRAVKALYRSRRGMEDVRTICRQEHLVLALIERRCLEGKVMSRSDEVEHAGAVTGCPP